MFEVLNNQAYMRKNLSVLSTFQAFSFDRIQTEVSLLLQLLKKNLPVLRASTDSTFLYESV